MKLSVTDTVKQSKGERTRARIVETAARMFSQDGFRATSLREIAAVCGMTHPGLLYHFANKEALLSAVLEWRDEQDLDTFRRNGSTKDRGLGVLRGMVALAREASSSPGLIELFTALSAEATARDHPAHDYFQKRYRRIHRGTKNALKRAAEQGYLRADLATDEKAIDDAAHELVALQDGLQVQWLLDPLIVDMAGILERRISRLLTVDLWAE